MAAALTARDQLPQWRALAGHARRMHAFVLAEALADPQRAARCTHEAGGLRIDLSRQNVDEPTLALLLDLAQACDWQLWRDRLLAGEPVNATEGRAAWHTALRTPPADAALARSLGAERERMLEFAEALRAGAIKGAGGRPIDTVLSIGIGGSDLGPRLVTEALGPASGPRLHFVANVDPAELDAALAGAEPESTAIVAISKSFSTLETQENLRAALAWFARRAPHLDPARHLYAVSSRPEKARAAGVPAGQVLTFPEWVGGRHSVWSACGLPVAIAHGRTAFEDLLRGAATMDAHFAAAPPARNVPLLLALLGVWHVNFLALRTRAVFAYAQRLRHLAPYLQQLEMESLGKRVDRDGRALAYDTGPVVWGDVGTTAQHSVFQFLHQGTQVAPVDFVTVAAFERSVDVRHRRLNQFALAQADALALGDRALGESLPHAPPAYAAAPGNRPSTVVALPRLDAASVGALLALYEHRTFVQSVIWNINAFDQWGVEIGKRLLGQRLAAEAGD
jgi:glucose-6-phosphate isomerase